MQELNDEIDKSFKIPKKRTNEEANQPEHSVEVLSKSYYNLQTPSQLYSSPTHSGGDNVNGPNIYNITNTIFNTLNDVKEKPKKYDPTHILKQTIPDCDDETLPKELTSQFQPLFCKLCAMQLTSNAMAKLHYKSKNHEKKVRKYLIEYSERTGEPLHKRAKVTPTGKGKEEDVDPRYFHCDVCDLALTGKMHAASHYMGKNHQKALLGYKAPAGKGYYDPDGKWVRLKSTPKVVLPDGEDTFGLDFRKEGVSAPVVVETPKLKVTAPKAVTCTICDVVAPGPEQIEMHYKGQKHQKKLKQLGLQDMFVHVDDSVKCILPTQIPEPAHKFSSHRTPSGQYYCKTCNLTLNSELQFKQHINSKNHTKKSQQSDNRV